MFVAIKKLEEISQLAVNSVGDSGGIQLNFSGKYSFDVKLTQQPELLDVVQRAIDWQAVECPPHLQFSHGQFITRHGIPHIVEELKNKPDSNRAIISLISQEHIVSSGDLPIPSFMIVQFNIDREILYVTSYFRALEVSSFFRINIEEIRMIIEEIRKEILTFKTVRLHVIAFRAYIQRDIDLLEKPALDLMEEIALFLLMQNELHLLPDLLRQKALHSTVASTLPLENILRNIEDKGISKNLSPNLQKQIIKTMLQDAISKGGALQKIREKSSHHEDVSQASAAFRSSLESLATEVARNV